MSEQETVVSLKNVVKEFRSGDNVIRILNGIDFEVYKNEFAVIIGESGCGKTTLMNIIGGMNRMTGGELRIDGKDFSHPTEKELTEYRRKYIGFIFQEYNLMPNLTAYENVEIIAELADSPMDAMEAIKKVGLADRANHFPSQLSGGQRQRVAIARALVKNPKLILADEPTAALDYETGLEVLSVIERIVKSGDATVLMVTHNPEIAKMADRVIKMRSGKIADIQHNPHPLSAEELVW